MIQVLKELVSVVFFNHLISCLIKIILFIEYPFYFLEKLKLWLDNVDSCLAYYIFDLMVPIVHVFTVNSAIYPLLPSSFMLVIIFIDLIYDFFYAKYVCENEAQ